MIQLKRYTSSKIVIDLYIHKSFSISYRRVEVTETYLESTDFDIGPPVVHIDAAVLLLKIQKREMLTDRDFIRFILRVFILFLVRFRLLSGHLLGNSCSLG